MTQKVRRQDYSKFNLTIPTFDNDPSFVLMDNSARLHAQTKSLASRRPARAITFCRSHQARSGRMISPRRRLLPAKRAPCL
jgi:hypothetical protein